MDLKLTPSSSLSFLFSYRMTRGHEEISTSQVGRRSGIPWETPTASSLVVIMSVEELKLYSQIPTEINLEMSDDVATSTLGEASNVVYFTRKKLVASLHLPVPSLVN